MVRRSDGLRSAKTSSISRDGGPPPSGISHQKWLEIQEEENANRIINSIREYIIKEAMDTVYMNYLESKSYSFVVNCAHTAWLQLFNWMNLKCNPGQTSKSVRERWTGDEEAKTVPKDNWVCGNVEIRKITNEPVDNEECKTICCEEEASNLLPKNMPVSPPVGDENLNEAAANKIVREPSAEVPSTAVIDEASDEDKRDEREKPEDATAKIDIEPSESDRSETLSIFTRTINMPRHKLPIARSSSGPNNPIGRGIDICKQKSWRSWRLDSVQAPRKLSVERLPANRLDIKYGVIAEPRSTSSARVDLKKKPSSKLFTRASEAFKPKRESKNTPKI